MTDETLLSWIDRGQLVAALLVAIGVAGEFLLQFAARPLNRRIEYAREVESLQLRERTAHAELALAELQKHARPRTLDPTARAAIIEWLSAAAPDGPIRIGFNSANAEPVEFARLLAAAIREAHWTVTSVTGGLQMGRPAVGLVIQFNADEPPSRVYGATARPGECGATSTTRKTGRHTGG